MFVRKTNERANAANLKDKIYEIHPTVSLFAQSESCQTQNKLLCLAGFSIWKDASLTRSGSFFCVCALSDSTFHVPELVVQIKKLSILRCKKYPVIFMVLKKIMAAVVA